MINHTLHHTLPAVRALLPQSMMRSPRAWAMLLAIGLQESQFLERRQLPNGPARGFWQFERGGGTKGVLTHPSTKEIANGVLTALRYHALTSKPISEKSRAVHYALHDNDVLAGVMARLLLWTLPGGLPERWESERAWEQYLEAWRPGQPHPKTWDAYYTEAWNRVATAWPSVAPDEEWRER